MGVFTWKKYKKFWNGYLESRNRNGPSGVGGGGVGSPGIEKPGIYCRKKEGYKFALIPFTYISYPGHWLLPGSYSLI
jgi:hypothetical protein